MKPETVFGQPSYKIESDSVTAWISELGGQLAPVRFQLPNGPVEPFSVAPWAEEDIDLPPILKALRGDFFCLPFGGNDERYLGEKHPVHGETANLRWSLDSSTEGAVQMSVDTTVRKGHVNKEIFVLPGQTAIYQRHTISGMSGPMSLGHHAMVRFRSPGFVSVSPFGFGQVFPAEFENPVQGGYSALKPGATFGDLTRVPALDGSFADLSHYPEREGFEDLVMVYSALGSTFAWTAVHFPEEGYVWYSLKDPRILTGTVLWHSNGGRHYSPWSGRHRGVLGLEEVTSSFHWGLAGSVGPSDANSAGYRTYVDLDPANSFVVSTIIGVAPSQPLSGPVANIEKIDAGILISDAKGGKISVEIEVGHIYGSHRPFAP